MKIGYACLTVSVPETSIKGLTLKNVTDERLSEIIDHNLNSLERILDYNITNGIKMFRISSDIIPFGSSPANKLNWPDIFENHLSRIGTKIDQRAPRISMHPGQYTVLNSPNPEVVVNSILDLEYHTKFLERLSTGQESKIILHIGGVYGDKKEAVNRFCNNFTNLDERVRGRIVIENDDKLYNIADVLDISSRLNIPVVYDNLHNKANCYDKTKTDAYWISECAKTWKTMDGSQEIHYSQQDADKRLGAHSLGIAIDEFLDFYNSVKTLSPDIMLEVKNKNVSALKCINCINPNGRISLLEKEWSRYKYAVLERSAAIYNQIRNLLKDKNAYPVLEFYRLIEAAMRIKPMKGSILNAALHVYGYFKEDVSDKEKRLFAKYTNQDTVNTASLKKFLFSLAQSRKDKYLLESLYFYDF